MVARVVVALVSDDGECMAQVCREETVPAPFLVPDSSESIVGFIDLGRARIHSLTSEALQRFDEITKDQANNYGT